MQRYTAAVITVSDKGYAGLREDLSGPLIAELLEQNGFDVVGRDIVPDEKDQIVAALRNRIGQAVALIVTTGGTGFAPRDVTPEATLEVCQRRADGVAEAMRIKSLALTDRAMISRAVCGIADRSVILNLPGSPKACRENLGFVLSPLRHGIDALLGNVTECARK
ncbi:MAG TPA: MogA/MoaB family molybdenum cofactor biosynthesis protein [Candidatus Stercoripulliclostridium merdipullorum]|uniref:MogA/MoaB family molybdenum cofactor biosynthesis protein n=1 Tax=Candidatus Stercoripulliclostridium merdipullorum TaxID=2840952 RepID=A0A9D1SXI1_9FIRM|nr:MogA/MoaB family molybdenum cofactor biosynthesis protein [Candidatus Stercoripulliclostridium merdipullorum]